MPGCPETWIAGSARPTLSDRVGVSVSWVGPECHRCVGLGHPAYGLRLGKIIVPKAQT